MGTPCWPAGPGGPGLRDARVCALHSHLGRQVRTRAQAVDHVRAVLAFADTLRARLGLELELLDLGGGLACPTVTPISTLAQRLAGSFQREPSPPNPALTIGIGDYVATLMGEVRAHAQGRRPPRAPSGCCSSRAGR